MIVNQTVRLNSELNAIVQTTMPFLYTKEIPPFSSCSSCSSCFPKKAWRAERAERAERRSRVACSLFHVFSDQVTRRARLSIRNTIPLPA